MKIFGPRVSRAALACAFFSAMGAVGGQPAWAQPLPNPQIPLNDFCVIKPTNSCTTGVIGTRTITSNAPSTVTPILGGVDVRTNVNVDFDGQLQLDALEITGTGVTLSQIFYDAQDAIDVRASANYDAQVHYQSRSGVITYMPDTNFSFNSLNVTKLGIALDDMEYYDPAGNDEGFLSLHSIDPTAIVNNSTAVTGRFAQTENTIRYGTISGTATLVANPGITELNDYYQYTSPYALKVDVTSTVTTQLDETGLTTPKIAVTDGIAMNGSKITGLAAGTKAADAVNLAQLNAEARERRIADSALASDITAETLRRARADAALSHDITIETLQRTRADAALSRDITTETLQRTRADAALSHDIAIETLQRTRADTTLARNITTETSQRMRADAALQQRILRETEARRELAADLQSESNARAAADLALGNRITGLGTRVDALTTRVDTIEKRVDRLDRKLASSTAVAVAMSGNTFLPNTTFNLTANVATYDGAQAGAFQMGAMVSDNVAVNAGVASAFNKGGKTAGRVGFTVGW